MSHIGKRPAACAPPLIAGVRRHVHGAASDPPAAGSGEWARHKITSGRGGVRTWDGSPRARHELSRPIAAGDISSGARVWNHPYGRISAICASEGEVSAVPGCLGAARAARAARGKLADLVVLFYRLPKMRTELEERQWRKRRLTTRWSGPGHDGGSHAERACESLRARRA
jgi:hypothetical protein